MNKPQGGKREGAGRPPMAEPPKNRAFRCTQAGWDWLNQQATGKGYSSVGKWADAKGRKAPKRKANVAAHRPSGLQNHG